MMNGCSSTPRRSDPATGPSHCGRVLIAAACREVPHRLARPVSPRILAASLPGQAWTVSLEVLVDEQNKLDPIPFKLLVVPGYSPDSSRLVHCAREALPVVSVVEEDLLRARFWFEREVAQAPSESIVVFVDPFEGERGSAGDYCEWIQELRDKGGSLALKPVFVLFTDDESLGRSSASLSQRQRDELRRYWHVNRRLGVPELTAAVSDIGLRVQHEWIRFPRSGQLEPKPVETYQQLREMHELLLEVKGDVSVLGDDEVREAITDKATEQVKAKRKRSFQTTFQRIVEGLVIEVPKRLIALFTGQKVADALGDVLGGVAETVVDETMDVLQDPAEDE